MMLPGQPFPPQPVRRKLPAYDTIMLLYLLTGAALLPLIIGQLLVEFGLMEAMDEDSAPWLYGYVVFTTIAAAFVLFVAWIPAIYVCIKYRKHWRAVVPAAAILVLTAGLFFGASAGETPKATEYALGGVAVFYAFVAFGVGLEWLLKRAKPEQLS